MNFDPSVLEFVSVENLNLQDLVPGNFGVAGAANGDLTVSWFDNTNTTGVTIPDQTVIFQLCFEIIGGAGTTTSLTFSDNPTIIEVVNGNGANVGLMSNNGTVTINSTGGPNDLIITASDVAGNVGDTVCIDVSVENFDNILSFQWSMNFDPSVLSFVSVENLNLQDLVPGNFGVAGAANGDLTVSWFDNTNTTGVTVADQTVIFQVCLENNRRSRDKYTIYFLW